MPTSKCTRQNLDSYININLLKKKSWNLQPTNLTTSFTQQKNHEDLFWRASFFPSIIFLSMWQFMLAFFVMEAVLRIRPAHLWRRLKVLGSVTCYLTLKKPHNFHQKCELKRYDPCHFLREYLQQHRTYFSQVLATRSTFSGKGFWTYRGLTAKNSALGC